MSGWFSVLTCAAAVAAAVAVAPGRQQAARPFGGGRPETGPELVMAYALDLLALALAGGAPIVKALSTVSDATSDPETREILARVAAGHQWGLDATQAWASAPRAWRPAATAFALCERAGAAPARLLHQAATDVRLAENERVATAGAKVGVRIVLPLGLCFLPAFLLITVVPLVLGLVQLGS